MYIPVFSRGANPRVDQPIHRKSHFYCAGEVAAGRARYIVASELWPRGGIIARELLSFHRGELDYRPEPSSPRNNKRIPGPLGFGSGEVEGTHFRQPSDPLWQEQHGMATRSLRARAFMSLKAWKQQFAVPAPPIV
jgi:hypothetical protein